MTDELEELQTELEARANNLASNEQTIKELRAENERLRELHFRNQEIELGLHKQLREYVEQDNRVKLLVAGLKAEERTEAWKKAAETAWARSDARLSPSVQEAFSAARKLEEASPQPKCCRDYVCSEPGDFERALAGKHHRNCESNDE